MTSPETQFTPPGTVAEIPFAAAAFAYDNYTHTIYVAPRGSQGAIIEVNASTNAVVGQLELPNGSFSSSIVFDPDNDEVYYNVNGRSGQDHFSGVIAVDAKTNEVVANVSGIDARDLAVDPLHDRVFASELVSSNDTFLLTAAVIDGRTNTVAANLTLFKMSGPEGCCYLGPLMYNPISGYLYESSGAYGADGGFGPFQITYNALGDWSAVGNLSDFPSYGTANYAFDPTTGFTYVANGGDTSSMGAYNPPYVVPGDNITVLSGTQPVSAIAVEAATKNGTLGDIFFDAATETIIVANGTLDSQTYTFSVEDVTLIDAGTQMITRVIPVQNGGIDCLFYDDVNGNIYAATPSTVFVISPG